MTLTTVGIGDADVDGENFDPTILLKTAPKYESNNEDDLSAKKLGGGFIRAKGHGSMGIRIFVDGRGQPHAKVKFKLGNDFKTLAMYADTSLDGNASTKIFDKILITERIRVAIIAIPSTATKITRIECRVQGFLTGFELGTPTQAQANRFLTALDWFGTNNIFPSSAVNAAERLQTAKDQFIDVEGPKIISVDVPGIGGAETTEDRT